MLGIVMYKKRDNTVRMCISCVVACHCPDKLRHPAVHLQGVPFECTQILVAAQLKGSFAPVASPMLLHMQAEHPGLLQMQQCMQL